MDDNDIARLEEATENSDAEAIFKLGLNAWENFEVGSNLEKAKKLIGSAKSMGHPLAELYLDIICAFEEANKENILY